MPHSSYFLVFIVVVVFLSADFALAWTGPTQAAPNGNVAAPINVGIDAQVKSGTIGVNGIAVFGNSLLQASSYLNWGATAGLSGYGIRDNAGTLEFKNSGGTGGTSGWKSLQTIINEYITLAGSGVGGSGTINYVPKFTAGTTVGNSQIFDNGTNVGIGTVSPTAKIHSVDATNAGTAGRFVQTNATASNGVVIQTQNVSAADAALHVSSNAGANPVLVARNSGNVGIGTASPAWSLDISNATAPVVALREVDTAGSTFLGQDGNNFFIRRGAIGAADALTVSSGGNVGVGTASPAQRFSVAGTLGISQAGLTGGQFLLSSSGSGSVLNDTGTGGVAIQSQGTSGLILTSFPNLRVGIGTLGPTAKLEVVANSSNDAIYGYNNVGGVGVRGYSNSNVGGSFQSAGSNYGVYGQSGGTYGIYGRTMSATSGGVLGYSGNGAVYGILGHNNSYSLYGNGASYVTGTSYAAGFSVLSDRRLKNNIRPIEDSLWKLAQLDGVTFDWKGDTDGHAAGKHDVGVIAQDVEKVLPEAVTIDIDSGYKAVDYPRLVPLLIEAIKEQQGEIEALRTETKELRAGLEQMRTDKGSTD